MKKFPSISSYTHLVAFLRSRAAYMGVPVETLPVMQYRGTVKLHGTNAGVAVSLDGTIVPQSRDITLSPQHTNMGFLGFVEGIDPAAWTALVQQFLTVNGIETQTDTVTIFGEWCGQGIQKGTGLSMCPKHFVIFGAAQGDDMLPAMVHPNLSLNREGIFFSGQGKVFDITVDPTNFQVASDQLNILTDEVEQECPWVKAVFGAEGIGEGIVWCPVDPYLFANNDYWFKTKGEKHKVRANPRGDVAPVDIERVETIKECVDIVLTENRMFQMVADKGLTYETTSIGPFLKAVCEDIIKEEMDVITENGLDWKDVGKLVQSYARAWFMTEITLRTMSQ